MLKNKLRGIWIGVTAALFVVGSAVTAYAETQISEIRVNFKNNYDSDGGTILEPNVTAGGSHYEVTGVEWSKDLEKWKPGSKITATVYLSASDGYNFRSSYKSSKATVSGGDFISAKRDDEDGSLKVKASYYPVVQLGMTEKAGWSDAAKTRAIWKKVPYATAYQLRLYHGDDEYVTTLTLEGTNVDLTQHIKKEGNYFYEVRATSKDSSDANYMRSGAYVTSEDSFLDNLGETGGRWRETRDGRRYTDDQGVEAVNGWRYILGTWYYFDENGYAVSGWRFVNDKWYYMDADCKMHTGWLNLGDKWYYLDTTGAMLTGWQQITPTDWYYFYDDGSMAANTMVDGAVLTESGRRQ